MRAAERSIIEPKLLVPAQLLKSFASDYILNILFLGEINTVHNIYRYMNLYIHRNMNIIEVSWLSCSGYRFESDRCPDYGEICRFPGGPPVEWHRTVGWPLMGGERAPDPKFHNGS